MNDLKVCMYIAFSPFVGCRLDMVNSNLLEEFLELTTSECDTVVGRNKLWKPMCGKHDPKLAMVLADVAEGAISTSNYFECASTKTRSISPNTEVA